MRLSSSNAAVAALRRGLTVFVLTCIAAAASAAAPRPWLDVSASFEQRAASLVAQMTLEESRADAERRAGNRTPGCARLRLVEWGLHGVARAGRPRSFRRRSAWPRPSMCR
jgi:beta-glucosidase